MCTGTTCHVKGAKPLLETFEREFDREVCYREYCELYLSIARGVASAVTRR